MNQRQPSSARRLLDAAIAALSLTTLAVACSATADPTPGTESDVDQTSDELYVRTSTRWLTSIPVCWETTENSVGDPQLTNIRNWSRDAITRRWGPFMNLQFTGWGNCPDHATFFGGVRVVVKSGRAVAGEYGTAIIGMVNGVTLDSNGSEAQVRATAVHEFGHVLSFAHEQNRPSTDTPSWCLPCTTTADCSADPWAVCIDNHCHQGPDGDQTIGAWDQESIMNYCGTNSTEFPSYTDIVGVEATYGKPLVLPHPKGNVTATQLTGGATGFAYVALDGSVRFGSIATGGTWATYTTLSPAGTVPTQGGIVMSRRGTTAVLDVFYVDNNGALKVSTRSAAGAWTTATRTPSNTAPPGARLAVEDSQAHVLDVFFVGNDGAIKQLWSDNNYGQVKSITSANFAAPGAGIAAGLETASLLDVFVVGTNGAVKIRQGNGNTFSNTYTLTSTNLAPSGAPLATAQVGDGDLNVFVVGNDGALKIVYFFFTWFTENLSATGFAPLNSVIGATPKRSGDRLDVFVVGNDGATYNTTEPDSWSEWTPLTVVTPAGFAAPGAPVAAADTSNVFTTLYSSFGRSVLNFGSVWQGRPFY